MGWGTSKGFWGIFRDFMEFYGIKENIRDFKGFKGIWMNFEKVWGMGS